MHPREWRGRIRPNRWAVLAAAALALGTAVVGGTAGATGAATATRTRATIFRPFTSSGTPAAHVNRTVHGYCWTGSLASARSDAWRCAAGNEIIDPCFSSAKARGIVLCSASGPWSSSLLKMKLTKKLPRMYANRRRPSTRGFPWALRTTSGWRCELVTGATTVVHGVRLSYFCKGTNLGLWRSPARRFRTWRIYAAPSSATTLRRRVGISSAWF